MIIKGEIWIGNGEVIPDGYVLIQGQHILEVGEAGQLSADRAAGHEVMDTGGCPVTPGFIDAHCHIGMWEDSLGFEGDDGNEDTDPCMPQLRALDAINPMDRAFADAVKAGVTTVVTGPGSSNVIGGQFCALKTMGRCVDDMVILPAAAMKFALGENPKASFHPKNQTPVTRMAVAALIREQLAKAQKYGEQKKRAEEDSELEPPEFDAKCDALIPVLAGEMDAHFHAHRADDIFTALRVAREFGLKAVIIHATEGHLIADVLAREQARVICGPVIAARTKPELAGADLKNTATLLAAGVKAAIATDHPELPIQTLSLCAAAAATEGLSKQEALMTITAYPAAIYGLSGRIGTLEKGKDADILIFSGDPFALMAKPKTVFIDGKIVHSV